MPLTYLIMVLVVFFSAFAFSQNKDSIADISLKDPIKYYLASAANWNSEIEIYYNSKILSVERDIDFFGLNFVGKTCGQEYCFKFSTKQINFEEYRWYPSALGIDADFFRLVVTTFSAIGIPLNTSLLLVYLIHLAINLLFYLLIFSVIVSKIKSKILLIYVYLLFLAPWLFFGAMNIVFSPAIRFMPCLVYLIMFRFYPHRLDSKYYKALIIFAFLIATLHGFEFIPFMLAACLLMPRPDLEDIGVWIKKWLSCFALGMSLCLALWFALNTINSGSAKVGYQIIIHTLAKQTRFMDIPVPKFAIDSGNFELPHWKGVFRYFFETSGLLPHPFPTQILDLPFVKIALPILVFFSGVGVVVTFVFVKSFMDLRELDLVLLFSIILALVGSWLLSSYVYNHRHYMGLSVALLSVLFIGYLSGSKGRNVSKYCR